MKRMDYKIKNVLSLVINLAIIVITGYAMSKFFISKGDGNMQVSGFRSLKFFTNLSNWFAAIGSLLCVPFNLRNLKTGTNLFPKAVFLTKFFAAVSVTVTFLTCVFFLGPINILILAPRGVPPFRAYSMMFSGNTFFLHFLTPVLSVFSVVVLERMEGFERKYVKYGVLSVFLYAMVYMVMVGFIGPANGGWNDFYHFTFGGKMYLMPVSGAVMFFATWLISKTEWKLYKKVNREE